MMSTKYCWIRQPKNAPSAEIAGKYIEDIKKRRKGLTPQLLVLEASDKKSPLHKCFTWNNSKAAELYRIEEARYILRNIEIIVIKPKVKTVKYRAFIAPSDCGSQNTSYKTIGEICACEDLSTAYQEQLLSRLLSIKDKLKRFPAFKDVVNAIEKVKI